MIVLTDGTVVVAAGEVPVDGLGAGVEAVFGELFA